MLSDGLQYRRGAIAVVSGLGLVGVLIWSTFSLRASTPVEHSFQGRSQGEEAIIARVIKDSICWALTKDRALQESTMAHDEDLFYFWTGSTHTVVGWQQHLKTFDTFMDPRFKAIRTEVRDLRIHRSRSGDVAWYSAMLDDISEWDGKRGMGEDIRWTGVLEKRDGKWVIVQMHASLAADKVRERVMKESK